MRRLATALCILALSAWSVPAGGAAERGRAGQRGARPGQGFARRRLLAAVVVLAAAASPSSDAAAGQAGSTSGAQSVSTGAEQSGNEIDRFMERVLENRDASWRRIGDFVLREVETLAVESPAELPIAGFRREYEWYVREDVVVRSPQRFDGVDIGETERREYEAEWLRRQRERRDAERREEGRRNAEEAAADAGRDAGPRDTDTAGEARTEPEFISDAGYFMEFAFEPGNYYLAGYETLAGREVVKIEYYPGDLFDKAAPDDAERDEPEETDGRREVSIRIRLQREQFAKTSLVTFWIDPEVHEVVRYTFDNVGLDFLPGRWLVRVDGWHASIEMAQPIGGVWLPRRMTLTGRATTALGAFELRFTREYSDYREALTGGRLVGFGDVPGDPR